MSQNQAGSGAVAWAGAFLDEPDNDATFDTALDERFEHQQTRERREAQDAKLRANLNHPKRGRSVYLTVASQHRAVTHAAFRVLFELAHCASPDLSNAFPLRKRVARSLGMSVATYNSHLTKLRNLGWLRTYEFRRADGTQSSSGIQFCIPRGVLPLEGEWNGPADFSNRQSGTPKVRKGRAAVIECVNNG